MSAAENVKEFDDLVEKKLAKVSLNERSDSGITLSAIPVESEHNESDNDTWSHDSGASCGASPNHSKFATSIQGMVSVSPLSLRKTLVSNKVKTADIEDGTRLNQYLLKEDLGRGSYGMVKLVYNEDDNNLYAMKIMSKKKLLRQAGFARRPMKGGKKPTTPLDRVYREIALLKKLDHPNVVKLVEVLDDPDDDSLYMVFELMKEGEVLDVPTTEPLKENVAQRYFRDVLLGLEYLHYQKIIHRDIKPSNLLLDDHNRVKIADFGVSQEFSDGDAEISSTVGTPAFLPPEAVSGVNDKFYGKPLDIWALGITLYSLVYGETPFKSPHILELHEKICNHDVIYPSTPKVSVECRELMGRMLTKDPALRITMKDIKVHRWVTQGGVTPMPSETDNCQLVTVTDDDVRSCVKVIPKLKTLILVKSMLKKHSFKNPLTSSQGKT
ncbi:calcium/calmodulin-dependent protein kinase kinase 1-like isoform X1 [Clavelina lepadiformis]|uniref:calcium/calmodulin-dependent protein kinase kinase 1-like isoform X1 n=1 Tax=Clavelina lepadiformis TaxID=159417 RepID=UPI004042ED15